MRKGNWKMAREAYYLCAKVYNRWKVNNEAVLANDEAELVESPIPLEFGVDDYIALKAAYAEAIMNDGDIDQALDKFENVKRNIETEIVYENPYLFVNVCNQLANCYLLKSRMKMALENFE